MTQREPQAQVWAIHQVLEEMELQHLYSAGQVLSGRNGSTVLRLIWAMAVQLEELRDLRAAATLPLDIILHCPVCHMQHVDIIDPIRNPGWQNPPHSTHTCLGCGCIWTPCDRPTEGVDILTQHGAHDTWPHIGRKPAPVIAAAESASAPAGDPRPAKCRDRLREERKAYPRSGCGGCQPTNKHKFTCPHLGDGRAA